mgnify:CR=1 FL=1
MSKKAKSEANQTTTSQPITLQDVEGVTFAGNSTGGGSINITDGGAIKGGLDLAGLTVEKAAELTLGLVAGQAQASQAAMDKGLAFAMNAGRSDVATMQDTTQKILYMVGIVAAAYVLSMWGK